MAGRPFKVGRFAHTLRVRLMREHLGVDVDSLYEEDLMAGFDEALDGVRSYLLLAAARGPVYFEHGPALEAAAEQSVERRTRSWVWRAG